MGESVSLFREPDAGNLPVRFDEREQETGPSQTGLRRRRRKPRRTATGRLQSLRLFSTLLAITLTIGFVCHALKLRIRYFRGRPGPGPRLASRYHLCVTNAHVT